MRPRHEFQTDSAYMEYLRLYYAGLALQQGYPIGQGTTNLSHEESLAKSSIKVADCMIKLLYAPAKATPQITSHPLPENGVNPHQSPEELKLKKELLLLMNNEIFTEEEKNNCTSQINKHDVKWLTKSIARAKELIEFRTKQTPATEKQKELIQKLMKSHVVREEDRKNTLAALEKMSIAAAATTIDYWTKEIDERKRIEKEAQAA